MKIAICGSMVFSEKMLQVKEILEAQGHTVRVSKFLVKYLGHDQERIETLAIKHKTEEEAIMEYWQVIKDSDAILVLNYDKNGSKNYIGGNSFLEIGFAYVLGKKIFLINPIPDNKIYKSEIEAMKPVILDGDLNRLSVSN
jgi:nucleoside 2-deoxyribosyltransferase